MMNEDEQVRFPVLFTTTVSLLAGALVYAGISAYSLLSQPSDCLYRYTDYITPACRAFRQQLAVPGRHELTVALACALAAAIASVTTRDDPVRTSSRIARILQPVILSAVLVVLASQFDNTIRGFAEGLATTTLLLLAMWVARGATGVWKRLGGPRGMRGETERALRHRLAVRVLTGLLVAVGSATVVTSVASKPDMPRVQAGGVLLATAVYACGAAALLLLGHYTSLHSKYQSRQVVGGERLRTRWLVSSSVLLAGVLLVAVGAPVASGPAIGLLEQILPTHRVTTKVGTNCERSKQLCQKPKGPIIRKKPRPTWGHIRPVAPITLLDTIARLSLWLVPLAALLYFLRESRRREAGGRSALRLWLAGITQWLRRRSRRARAAFERRLPDALVDLGASAGLARRGGRSRLSTEEQVVRYYLDAVRHADRHGIARRPAQTPEEFEDVLRHRLDAGEEAWATLTADFIEARFSTRSPSGDQPDRARAAWRAVRVAIRQAAGTTTALRR